MLIDNKNEDTFLEGIVNITDRLRRARKNHDSVSFKKAKDDIGRIYKDFENIEKYDNFLRRAQETKYIGSGQTFQSRWKTVTVTFRWEDFTITEQEFKMKIEKFLTRKKFDYWIFTIEHIDSNIHCHIACHFTPKKWPKAECYKDLSKYFPSDQGFYIQLKDSRKKCHLTSKSDKQAEGYIQYILKDEPSKKIYKSHQFQRGEICDSVYLRIFFYKQLTKCHGRENIQDRS